MKHTSLTHKQQLLLLIALTLSMVLSAADLNAADKRVMIISIDGLRPDLLIRAKASNIRSLYTNGSFSFWARTTDFGNTLPSHTSMLTGVKIPKHGITWNGDKPNKGASPHPKVPTLFELAKKAGYSTSLVAGKSKFWQLAKPDTVDHVSTPKKTIEDNVVAINAVKIIRQHKPQVMFVHFARVDSIGHAKGWGSAEQIKAVETADAALGKVLAQLKSSRVINNTLIILTSDHGGFGKTHNGGDPRGRHIPWIVVGPGVKKNFDLTTLKELVVNTEDSFATACDHLEIALPDNADGKPIKQIYQKKK
jgi:predicted AlkP superfamily pyrophosphatase or phosphodiesterase